MSKNGLDYEMKVCDGRKKDMDIKRVKKELAIQMLCRKEEKPPIQLIRDVYSN